MNSEKYNLELIEKLNKLKLLPLKYSSKIIS